MDMERLLTASTVVLVSAHVTTTVLGDPRAYFLAAALATATVATVAALPPGRWTDYARAGFAYHAAYAAAAWFLDAFVVYCVAYASSRLILVWIDLAHARGVVTYDPATSHFAVTRGALYALVRAVTHALTRWGAPPPLELLTPAAIAATETGIMATHGSAAYTFGVASHAFAVYALLKTVVLLAVPRFETWLLAQLAL